MALKHPNNNSKKSFRENPNQEQRVLLNYQLPERRVSASTVLKNSENLVSISNRCPSVKDKKPVKELLQKHMMQPSIQDSLNKHQAIPFQNERKQIDFDHYVAQTGQKQTNRNHEQRQKTEEQQEEQQEQENSQYQSQLNRQFFGRNSESRLVEEIQQLEISQKFKAYEQDTPENRESLNCFEMKKQSSKTRPTTIQSHFKELSQKESSRGKKLSESASKPLNPSHKKTICVSELYHDFGKITYSIEKCKSRQDKQQSHASLMEHPQLKLNQLPESFIIGMQTLQNTIQQMQNYIQETNNQILVQQRQKLESEQKLDSLLLKCEAMSESFKKLQTQNRELKLRLNQLQLSNQLLRKKESILEKYIDEQLVIQIQRKFESKINFEAECLWSHSKVYSKLSQKNQHFTQQKQFNSQIKNKKYSQNAIQNRNESNHENYPTFNTCNSQYQEEPNQKIPPKVNPAQISKDSNNDASQLCIQASSPLNEKKHITSSNANHQLLYQVNSTYQKPKKNYSQNKLPSMSLYSHYRQLIRHEKQLVALQYRQECLQKKISSQNVTEQLMADLKKKLQKVTSDVRDLDLRIRRMKEEQSRGVVGLGCIGN